MIQPNELRLGNLILIPSKDNNSEEKIEVKEISKGYSDKQVKVNGWIYDCERLNGILLDDKILELLGFADDTSNNTRYLSPLHLQEENEGWHMRLYAGYVNRKPIHYMHQLQNFYFDITGKE